MSAEQLVSERSPAIFREAGDADPQAPEAERMRARLIAADTAS